MNEMPSPILLIGDHYVCNKNILASKKKYKDYEWIMLSATDDSPDSIRAIASERSFLAKPKVLLINDLPNQKAIREFLLNLVKNVSSEVKYIIWDSEGAIKLDAKTRSFNKTWSDFILAFKAIKDAKVIDNGFGFTDKEDGACITFIVEGFAKYKKTINRDVAMVFMNIVGKERSYIVSEIEKLSITAPSTITKEYVMDNTYPSSKEAILYKFNNALDETYSSAITTLNQFLEADVNSNVLAEIMMKKSRWQLAVAYYYSLGMGLEEIPKKIMQMGKFPSIAWHNDKLSYNQKKDGSEQFDDTNKIQEFMSTKMGIPRDHFNEPKEKARAEAIPMDFMAIQIVNSMTKNVINPNLGSMPSEKVRALILDKYLSNYLFISNKIKEIRYGSDPVQELYEMIVMFTDRTLREREPNKEDEFSSWR
jgi:DNA polymerase III delta subunit